MNRGFITVAMAAVLLATAVGCSDHGPLATVPPVSVQAPIRTIQGQVVRNEGNAYLIREVSGQQTRVYIDKNSIREPIAVGDSVIAQYDESTGYATSIGRTTSSLGLPASIPTHPQTVEGVVQRLEGNDYVVKDLAGSEVRLHVDPNTRLDPNITAGDRIVAVTNAMASGGPYVSNMYILGSPGVVQGEVVRIDGTSYVIRDLTGKEIRLNTNPTTVRNGNVLVGDRIVAYLGPSSTLYAESITKR